MAECQQCGRENIDEATYCMSCGSKISLNQIIDQPRYTNDGTDVESNPQCLWCRKKVGFKEEVGKLDSKFGLSAHKVRIFICNNCGYSHLFSLGRSIWDFD